MRLALLLLIACGDNAIEEIPAPVVALPADRELGELALMPFVDLDRPGWVPSGKRPMLLDGVPREGSPSWIAIDYAGVEAKLTYGTRSTMPYGCDRNTIGVTLLDGDAPLMPGLLWLRPLGKAWMPKRVPIVNGKTMVPTRADYTIGPITVENVRTEEMRGVINIVRGTRMIHQLTFQRTELEGADARPIDLLEDGPGVPFPLYAWSFGDELMLIVFKVRSYEGLNFKTIVVGKDSARSVASMSMYLYQCAM